MQFRDLFHRELAASTNKCGKPAIAQKTEEWAWGKGEEMGEEMGPA
jgi:hypothetical protein